MHLIRYWSGADLRDVVGARLGAPSALRRVWAQMWVGHGWLVVVSCAGPLYLPLVIALGRLAAYGEGIPVVGSWVDGYEVRRGWARECTRQNLTVYCARTVDGNGGNRFNTDHVAAGDFNGGSHRLCHACSVRGQPHIPSVSGCAVVVLRLIPDRIPSVAVAV